MNVHLLLPLEMVPENAATDSQFLTELNLSIESGLRAAYAGLCDNEVTEVARLFPIIGTTIDVASVSKVCIVLYDMPSAYKDAEYYALHTPRVLREIDHRITAIAKAYTKSLHKKQGDEIL